MELFVGCSAPPVYFIFIFSSLNALYRRNIILNIKRFKAERDW
jgi:hypothetical protein